MAKVYLSIGSNLGNKEQNLMNAIATVGSEAGIVRRVSCFYSSEPTGFISSNKFLNAVILVVTELSPIQLLRKTQEIETKLGRTKKSTEGYVDRIIDIDILLYDKEILDSPELKIPHPKMLERDFVMIPLREIAPDLDIFIE
jgi:2-amino-4-hydroxy-6-hydroxymethyldihydropteridine diphosphokinase